MMNSVEKYQVCITDITQAGINCSNPKITWEPLSSCVVIPCTDDNCDCVTVEVLTTDPDCDTCFNIVIECDDCDNCPAQVIKKCICSDNDDCGPCSICVDGFCVSQCDGICDEANDICVECLTDNQCPCNQVCIAGKCTCPAGTFENPDTQCCDACRTTADCPACSECVGGQCIPINCPGACDPATGECVECLTSGDCSGENQCCVDNKCTCCPGYVWDPITKTCIEKPDCTSDADCGPCEVCVNGSCVPLVCPDGQICINGECWEECDCNNPSCSTNKVCVNLGASICVCESCTGSCSTNSDCDQGCYCVNGTCVPNPCVGSCSTASDCGDGCGCYQGQCYPCTSLDCVNTQECIQALGCTCTNSGCKPSGCGNACTSGADCSTGCGCLNGVCVDCSDLDCETQDCTLALGCVCINGTCGDSPCGNFCSSAADCAPGCGCLNGICTPCSETSCDNSDCLESAGCVCVNGACIDDPCSGPCASGDDCPSESCGCLNGQCVSCTELGCSQDCLNAIGCECVGTGCIPSDCDGPCETNQDCDGTDCFCGTDGFCHSCSELSCASNACASQIGCECVNGQCTGDNEDHYRCTDPVVTQLEGCVKVVLALDKTGSMSGHTSVVQTAANSFINSVAASASDSKVGYVIFDTQVQSSQGLTNNAPSISLTASGSTNYTHALDEAYGIILDERANSLANQACVEYVVFFTDGGQNTAYSPDGTNPSSGTFEHSGVSASGLTTTHGSLYPRPTGEDTVAANIAAAIRNNGANVLVVAYGTKFVGSSADKVATRNLLLSMAGSADNFYTTGWSNPAAAFNQILDDIAVTVVTEAMCIPAEPGWTGETFTAADCGGNCNEKWTCGDDGCTPSETGEYNTADECLSSCNVVDRYACISAAECSWAVDGPYTDSSCDSSCGCDAVAINSVSYNCDDNVVVFSVTGGQGDVGITVSGGGLDQEVIYTAGSQLSLAAGTYTFTACAAAFPDCCATTTFDVNCCGDLTATTSNVGACTNSSVALDFTPYGGTAPYNYVINDDKGIEVCTGSINAEGTSTSTNSACTVTPTTNTTYTAVFTDSVGCTYTASLLIAPGSGVVMSVSDLTVCDNATSADITVSIATGTTPPYDIIITRGNTTVLEETGSTETTWTYTETTIITGAVYNITITDSAGCSTDGQITLTTQNCDAPVVTTSDVDYCPVPGVAQVVYSISGGTAPYSWSVDTTPVTTGTGTAATVFVTAGTYTLTATDANGQTATGSSVVTELLATDQQCLNCETTATATITGDVGNPSPIKVGDTVTYSYTTDLVNDTVDTDTWTVTAPSGALAFTDNGTSITFTIAEEGSHTIALSADYETGCDPLTANVNFTAAAATCDCTITVDTSPLRDACQGDPIIITGTPSAGCVGSTTVVWTVDGTQFDTTTAASGVAHSTTYTPSIVDVGNQLAFTGSITLDGTSCNDSDTHNTSVVNCACNLSPTVTTGAGTVCFPLAGNTAQIDVSAGITESVSWKVVNETCPGSWVTTTTALASGTESSGGSWTITFPVDNLICGTNTLCLIMRKDSDPTCVENVSFDVNVECPENNNWGLQEDKCFIFPTANFPSIIGGCSVEYQVVAISTTSGVETTIWPVSGDNSTWSTSQPTSTSIYVGVGGVGLVGHDYQIKMRCTTGGCEFYGPIQVNSAETEYCNCSWGLPSVEVPTGTYSESGSFPNVTCQVVIVPPVTDGQGNSLPIGCSGTVEYNLRVFNSNSNQFVDVAAWQQGSTFTPDASWWTIAGSPTTSALTAYPVVRCSTANACESVGTVGIRVGNTCVV